ncbi:hypothetical protein WI666_05280 [Vibrio cholerae]
MPFAMVKLIIAFQLALESALRFSADGVFANPVFFNRLSQSGDCGIDQFVAIDNRIRKSALLTLLPRGTLAPWVEADFHRAIQRQSNVADARVAAKSRRDLGGLVSGKPMLVASITNPKIRWRVHIHSRRQVYGLLTR